MLLQPEQPCSGNKYLIFVGVHLLEEIGFCYLKKSLKKKKKTGKDGSEPPYSFTLTLFFFFFKEQTLFF